MHSGFPTDAVASLATDKSTSRHSESNVTGIRKRVRPTGLPTTTDGRTGRVADWCVPTRLVARRGPLARLLTIDGLFQDGITVSYADDSELEQVDGLINRELTGLREAAAPHHDWIVAKRGPAIVLAAVVDEIPLAEVLCFVELHAADSFAGRRAYNDFAKRTLRLAKEMKYKLYGGAQLNNPSHGRWLEGFGFKPHTTLYEWTP